MASETSITSGTVLLVKLLLEELACGMYTYIYNNIVYSAENRLREAAGQAATSTYRVASHYTYPF